MERKVWTARGVMTDADKPVIAAIAGKSKPAARIFVTGEAAEGYLGDEAVRLLVNINDVYYENNTENVNTVRGKNAEILEVNNSKHVVNILTVLVLYCY